VPTATQSHHAMPPQAAPPTTMPDSSARVQEKLVAPEPGKVGGPACGGCDRATCTGGCGDDAIDDAVSSRHATSGRSADDYARFQCASSRAARTRSENVRPYPSPKVQASTTARRLLEASRGRALRAGAELQTLAYRSSDVSTSPPSLSATVDTCCLASASPPDVRSKRRTSEPYPSPKVQASTTARRLLEASRGRALRAGAVGSRLLTRVSIIGRLNLPSLALRHRRHMLPRLCLPT
jgi:hypothetical protein